MQISPDKIDKLIELYGIIHNYPRKSWVVFFCRDNNLNYNQWNAHIRGKQVIGLKIVYDLISIFPDLNLNWLFKDEGNILSKPIITEETTL